MVVSDDVFSFGIEGTGAGLRTAMREWGHTPGWTTWFDFIDRVPRS